MAPASTFPAIPHWRAGLALLILLGGLAFPWAIGRLASSSETSAAEAAHRAAREGDFVTAARLALAEAKDQPGQAPLWLLAGQYAAAAGDLEGAAACYEQALHLQPDLPTLLILEKAYAGAGLAEAAAQTWQALLDQPDLPMPVLHWLFEYHQKQADYPAARAALVRLIGLSPQDAGLHYRHGLLLAASDPEAARPELRRAAQLDPALQEAVRSLDDKIGAARRADDQAFSLLEAGRGLASLGEWTLAAEAFGNAVGIRPDFAEGWAYLGEARQQLSTQKDSNTGLAELQQALALDPGSAAAHTFMAFYWQRQQQPEKALQSIRAAVELAPTNPVLHVELGRVLARTGAVEDGLAAYQAAVPLAPYDPVYSRLVSEFTIEHDYQVREAGLPAARRALLLAENDPPNMINMARVLVHLNDLVNAERFLLRAIQVQPDYAPAHLQLGIVYILRGDKPRGASELELARALAPGTATADQAARLLQTYFP